MLAMATVLHASDPDLPKPLDATVAQGLITNPPFTRALNLSDSLQLTGVASVGGKPVADQQFEAVGAIPVTGILQILPEQMGARLADKAPVDQHIHAEAPVGRILLEGPAVENAIARLVEVSDDRRARLPTEQGANEAAQARRDGGTSAGARG